MNLRRQEKRKGRKHYMNNDSKNDKTKNEDGKWRRQKEEEKW